MDLSSSLSSSVKESSSQSSKKISSSSISSSSKLSSSLVSAASDISSEMDELLAAATGGRSALSDRVGGALRSADLEIDELLSGTSLGSNKQSSNISSSSVSSSSSKVTKMSSISQSSLEIEEGGSGPSVTSSVKQSNTSSASSASLVSEQKIVDGQLVKAETQAEKASLQSQSQKEKLVQDGQVLVDTGSKSETSSAGKLRATKEMSQAELDAFFQQDAAITGKPVEALNYDKDKSLFEITLADLPEFSPKELTVKIVGDVITVYGTHEEQTEGGSFKMHQYVRKFTVPKGLKTNNIEWNLNSDGALAITAGDGVKGGKSQVHLDCTIFKPRSFFKK